MRILITGNMGYVGPVLARHLRQVHPNADLVGYDAKYFAHCLTPARAQPEAVINEQHFGDITHLWEADHYKREEPEYDAG